MPGSFDRVRRLWIVACVGVAVAWSLPYSGANADDSRGAIRDYLAQPAVSGLSQAELSRLREFYAQRADTPAWTGSPEAESDAQTLQTTLLQADADGLEPTDYRVAAPTGYGELREFFDAEQDVLLTNAALRYASDLRDGRPALRNVDSDIELPADGFDAASALAAALEDRNLPAFLSNLAPPCSQYALLKAALAKYRNIAEQGGWPVVFHSGRALRRRLAFEDSAVASGEVDNVAEAVKRFQTRHGLPPTGVLDGETRAALNVPAADRALEILVNMERWRWLPRTLESRYVMINVPAAELRIVETDNHVLDSPVIVGRPKDPTPILRALALGVTVNPPWLVPPQIARKEILPKVVHNPDYMHEHHMVFREGGGIKQLPGAKNALGTIKIDLPNRFDVYLHDTPSRKLFNRDDRDVSHGCVRVEKILPLASYALTHDADSVSLLTSAVARGKTAYFPLSEPLPIYFLYWTAFVDSDGNVEYRSDIYDRDQRLLAVLNRHVPSRRMTSLNKNSPPA